MSDKQKVTKKSQLKRFEESIFGSKLLEKKEKKEDANEAPQLAEFNGEIYDDIDFYQRLLKEFIESTTGGSLPLQKSKKKRRVEGALIKGKKISYVVMEPLVNFVAPNTRKQIPPISEHLFASLFGRKREDVEEKKES